MSPQIKKLLSACAVATAGAVLVVLNAYVVKLPEAAQGFVGALLAGAVHYVNAYGTQAQVVEQLVDGKVRL